jgi:diguanylate cyclase (GGDEF)-like protein
MNTLRTEPNRPVSTTNRTACLVHIYPTGPDMGKRFALGEAQVVVGRDPDCDLCLNDSSVSRRHVRLLPGTGGYFVEDLQSTNGTYVNDEAVAMRLLKDGDYLRVGSSIFRFLTGGNVEADYHQVIYRLTIVDALTDVHNKRALVEFLDRELVRSCRHQRPLSLILFDIDKFKLINDSLGHLCGDHTLRDLAARLKATIRKDELFARYGGEEFAVVLPETDNEGAGQFGDRLRLLTEGEPFRFEDKVYPVTISVGVATTLGDADMTAQKLIQIADEKLYQAKNAGRNRVVR